MGLNDASSTALGAIESKMSCPNLFLPQVPPSMLIRYPALSVALLLLASTGPLRAAGPDFARDVRPILSQFCFKCHGPDEKARKARLRLDDRPTMLKRGVFVPGKPDESE